MDFYLHVLTSKQNVLLHLESRTDEAENFEKIKRVCQIALIFTESYHKLLRGCWIYLPMICLVSSVKQICLAAAKNKENKYKRQFCNILKTPTVLNTREKRSFIYYQKACVWFCREEHFFIIVSCL